MLRPTLRQQLDLAWSLADRYHLPAVTEENAFWAPSRNACTVLPEGTVQMPDETATPIATPTVAWLLWHITWWWTNAHRWADGKTPVPWDEHPWAGSAEAAVAQVRALHAAWVARLDSADLEAPVSGPWSDDATFARLAGWLNLELMKNVAEIGQLVGLHENR
ncbi:DinB family protein [Antribacter gilvus]|uniref:DinB family protein n=1 Tax=Antribacter gilvus TaxID=2304675 RepID=UPI000F78A056|nr:DinB family protein [Antribacter gilvus]